MQSNNKNKSSILYFLYAILFCILVFLGYIAGGKTPKNKNINTGELHQNIVQLPDEAIQDLKTKKTLEPGFTRYKFSYVYIIKIQKNVKSLTFTLYLPQTEKGKQYLSSLNISPQPRKIYNDGVNNIAEYSFSDLKSGEIIFTLEGFADLRTYDLETAKSVNSNLYPETNLLRYLNAEPYIESNDSYVMKIAKKIPGKTQEEIIENIYKYIQTHIKYTLITKNAGAREALLLGLGKCGEYSAVMTALCRAKNIPARIVTGNIARNNDTKHSWVEIYFKEYGWVAFDPTEMGTILYNYHNKELQNIQKKFNVSSLKSKYIALARNKLSPWFISYSFDEGSNADVKVEEKIVINKVE